MKKPIKSTDPRKKAIVAVLKEISNSNKVTNVYETETHYSGDCMKGGKGGYAKNGTFTIPKGMVVVKTILHQEDY